MLDACHAGAMIGKGIHAPFFNVFAGGDYKEVPPTDEGVAGLVAELVADHTIG